MTVMKRGSRKTLNTTPELRSNAETEAELQIAGGKS